MQANIKSEAFAYFSGEKLVMYVRYTNQFVTGKSDLIKNSNVYVSRNRSWMPIKMGGCMASTSLRPPGFTLSYEEVERGGPRDAPVHRFEPGSLG